MMISNIEDQQENEKRQCERASGRERLAAAAARWQKTPGHSLTNNMP